jgi:hypothetical protein
VFTPALNTNKSVKKVILFCDVRENYLCLLKVPIFVKKAICNQNAKALEKQMVRE